MRETILVEFAQTWDNFLCFKKVLAYSVNLTSSHANCCVGTDLLNFSFSNFSSESYKVCAVTHL